MDAWRNDQKKKTSSPHVTSKNRLAPRDHSKANGWVKRSELNSITVSEYLPERSESPEKHHDPSCKYNLRKSLAWDNAFFTSEGVLNPEELADVNRTFRKVYISQMPKIQEEARKSIESNGTLDSDIWGDENLEDDLFGNIRASIQRYQLSCSANLLPMCSRDSAERGKLDAAGFLKPRSPQHQAKPSVRAKKMAALSHSSNSQLMQQSPPLRTPKLPSLRLPSSSSGSPPKTRSTAFSRKDCLVASPSSSSMKESQLAKTLINKTHKKIEQPLSGKLTLTTHRRRTAAVTSSLSSAASAYSSVDSSTAETPSANCVRSSLKPSGLRPPSPKMGYFDAQKLSSSSRYTARATKAVMLGDIREGLSPR